MLRLRVLLFIIFILSVYEINAQTAGSITFKPKEYENALRNPLMGFTTINVDDHPWASVSHTFIRWNEMENNKSEGIDKIISDCNQKWKNAGAKKIKFKPQDWFQEFTLFMYWKKKEH